MDVVAGQEVYYLSHSVQFTQRCLYILTWTPPQPTAHAGALSPPLTLEQLLADLRLWLQMIEPVLTSKGNEIFFVPNSDEVEIIVNRDPRRLLEAERERYRQQGQR